jgi:hypothetical protein
MIKIIKYTTIPKYCREKKINNLLISENNNLIHYHDTSLQYYHGFVLDFIFYFGWFPHIQHIRTFAGDYDFIIKIFKIFENFQKSSKKFEMFIHDNKIELSLTQFFDQIIFIDSLFKKYFLDQRKKMEYDCFNCSIYGNKSNYIKISDTYNLCKYYYEDMMQSCCYNFKYLK